MAALPNRVPDETDVSALMRAAGVSRDEQFAATIANQIASLHAQVARLRELDLAGVEPALAFHVDREGRR